MGRDWYWLPDEGMGGLDGSRRFDEGVSGLGWI